VRFKNGLKRITAAIRPSSGKEKNNEGIRKGEVIEWRVM
jgi:hypothetical protein